MLDVYICKERKTLEEEEEEKGAHIMYDSMMFFFLGLFFSFSINKMTMSG